MNCNVAIHCTLVARNVVIVGCAEPWFIHAVAIEAILCPSITRAEALQTVNEAYNSKSPGTECDKSGSQSGGGMLC